MKSAKGAVRAALIDLPFTSAYRPNTALALLRGAAQKAGFECDLRYAKYAFVRAIGLVDYDLIAEQIPQDLLIGDFVFGAALEDAASGEDACVRLRAALAGNGRAEEIPDRVWELLPEYRQRATEFLRRLADDLIAEGYEVVGLPLSYQLAPSLALARVLGDQPSRPWIVAGGAYCDAEMGIALHESFPWIDFVCRGEGEELFPALLEALSRRDLGPAGRERKDALLGPQMDEIQGLVWRDGDKTIANGDRTRIVGDLDALPIPDYRDWLSELSESAPFIDRRELIVSFESSRGCWYGQKVHCIFCGLNGSSLTFRMKSCERVLLEIDKLEQLGVPNADATDLILAHPYFDDLLPRLAQGSRTLRIFYEIKVNLERDDVRMLARAGICALQPGIESLSSSMLRLMRKGAFAYQNVRLLKWCAEEGLTADWSILYGFPGEDPREYARMAEMIPYLVHLQPPLGDGAPVLLNRFSPMFDSPASFGIRSIEPVASYDLIFGSWCQEVRRIAYYFDFEPAPRLLSAEHRAMLEAVSRWIEDAGSYAFVMLDGAGRLLLFDSRPIAKVAHATLRGLERELYLACEGGAGVSKLAGDFGVSPDVIEKTLVDFVRMGWALYLDGRYLSLAVSLDELVPSGISDATLGPVCRALYSQRARALWGRACTEALG